MTKQEKDKALEEHKRTLTTIGNLIRFVREANIRGADAVEVVDGLQFLSFLREQIDSQRDALKKQETTEEVAPEAPKA